MGNLQFQPPPDWLMQEYMNSKSPIQTAAEGVQGVLGQYIAMQNQQKTQELSQEDRDIKIAQLRASGGQTAIDRLNQMRQARGLPSISMGAIPAAPAAPSLLAAPSQPESNYSSEADGALAVNPDGSHIVNHWNATMAGGPTPPMAKPQAPAMGSDPSVQEWLQMGDRAYTDKYGMDEAKRVKDVIGSEKNLQEKTNITIPQYGALQSGEPDALNAAFPGGIPPSLASSALAAQSRNVRVTTDPYGNPIRVPVAGGPATPIEIPGGNLNPLQKKLNPNEYKMFQSEVNDFDKDKTVTDNRTALNNMSNVEAMVNNYNPALTGPIASRQARAIAGEVGTLTDSDIARQSLDPSLLGRLKKAVSVAATGKLPQDQLDLLRQSIASIKKASQSRIYSVAQERAKRLSNNFGGKVSPEELMQSMNLPSNFSADKQTGPAIGTVEDGHRFKGGNPADPNSWELVTQR